MKSVIKEIRQKKYKYSLGILLLSSGCFSGTVYAQVGNGVDALAFGEVAQETMSSEPVVASKGMVVSASNLAAKIGSEVLKNGGNAADAAVAVAYAMAVTYPAAGNLGGGGFLTLRLPNGQAYFIDFREKAPKAATSKMFVDSNGKKIPNASILGWKAVAIPGTVAGMEMLRKRWGSKSRAELMAPAIKLAQNGYILTQEDIDLMATSLSDFAKDRNAAKIFLKSDGNPWKKGDIFRQKDLADTLQTISKHGEDVFYHGSIAKKIVDASKKHGGILSLKDFENYHPRMMLPLTCSYRGYHIDTAPPPSGGGIALCEMLNILSGYDLHKMGLQTVPAVERQVEAMRRAYSDRRDLGDPEFVDNPVKHLNDPDYAEKIRKSLTFKKAVNSSDLVPGKVTEATSLNKKERKALLSHERNETTHFSVIDKDGMAVSLTYTLNGWYGARVVAGNTGIIMNDEMDDFTTVPGEANMYGIIGGKANEIAPGKTPLSSMTPTIVSKDNKVFMVIGSPGGSRIPTIILSVITGVIDYKMNIQQAINLPRIHEQWQPQGIQLEHNALSGQVRKILKRKNYPLDLYSTWGIAEGILVGHDKNGKTVYYGGVDYRHAGGGAIGY